MKKNIKIGEKEYLMSASAYTQFKYKDETGNSLVKDLSTLANKYQEIQLDESNVLEHYEELEDFINMTLKIAYIMAIEGKSINGSFEDFLKEQDNYMSDVAWIGEVMELAISPLSGAIQKSN